MTIYISVKLLYFILGMIAGVVGLLSILSILANRIKRKQMEMYKSLFESNDEDSEE